MEDLIKVTPNKEKAESIMKMVETTLKMIETIDVDRFSSNITKEYYDVIREMLTVILLLDGYKTYGEGAHKRLIDYLYVNYKEFSEYELSLIDELRIKRNKIAYDGFFVKEDYVKSKMKDINSVIQKLKGVIEEKLS